MKRILILSAVKAKFLENTFVNQSVYPHSSYDLADYNDVKIVFAKTDWEVLINDINLLDYDLTIFRFEKFSKGIANVLSIFLKQHKKKYINTFLAEVTFGNKLIQNAIFLSKDLPIPKTLFIPRKNLLEQKAFIDKNMQFPFILKDIEGAKGKHNYLIKSFTELEKTIKNIDHSKEFIIQEFIPNSFDYRILVFNKKFIGSIDRRTRVNIDEHRNNAALGGVEEFLKPHEFANTVVKEISIKAAEACNIEIAGVDIVISDSNNLPYILEVNSSPGITKGSLEEESILKFLDEYDTQGKN